MKQITEETRKKMSDSHRGKPNGRIGFHWSDEMKEKLSKSHIGKHQSEETKRKISENHRKFQTENTKNKISISLIGHKLSEETKRKIGEKSSINLKGHKTSEETKQKIRKAHLGRKLSEEHKKNMKLSRIGRKLSEEHKKNIGLAGIGKKLSKEHIEKLIQINTGKILGLDTKNKIRKARSLQIFPIKDTKIELKIQSYLKQLNIEFFTHQYIKEIEHGYQCDILIPLMDLVIECDGDYWHKYPIGNEIDKIRTKELLEKGFKVLRLWECEINKMSVDDFKDKIKCY